MIGNWRWDSRKKRISLFAPFANLKLKWFCDSISSHVEGYKTCFEYLSFYARAGDGGKDFWSSHISHLNANCFDLFCCFWVFILLNALYAALSFYDMSFICLGISRGKQKWCHTEGSLNFLVSTWIKFKLNFISHHFQSSPVKFHPHFQII